MTATARRTTLVILVILALVGSGVVAGCGGGGPATVLSSELPVTATPDPRIFVLFAGLNGVGYDDLGGGDMHPVRQEVRDTLAAVDPAGFKGLAAFTAATSCAYVIAMVLDEVSAPPDLKTASTAGLVPDVAKALRSLWGTAGGTLWEAHGGAHDAYALELLEPGTTAIHDALAYCRAEESPVPAVQITPNLLQASGTAFGHLAPDGVFYIVVGPDALPAYGMVEELLHELLADSLRKLELDDKLIRFAPVLAEAKKNPVIEKAYPSARSLVEVCLVQAVARRVIDGADPAEGTGWATTAMQAGFLLTPALYAALPAYEAQAGPLTDYLADLLAGIDVAAVLAGE